MIRRSTFISAPLLILTVLFSARASGQEVSTNTCLECHEETYSEALSNPYLHTVVQESCPICHIMEDPPEDSDADINSQNSFTFTVTNDEKIFFIGELDADRKYLIKAVGTDNAGKKSTPVSVTVVPREIQTEQYPAINRLSGVTLEEVKKEIFVQASISWDTDTYATSEIEYIAEGKYPDQFVMEGTYSKKHLVVLKGLKHKTRYRFRVISRDLSGNVLRSKGHDIYTADDFSDQTASKETVPPLPNINFFRVLRISGKKGCYIEISTNKATDVIVSVHELIEQEIRQDDKHGYGLTSPAYTTMEVCYGCHEQNASHPVNVKSEGLKTVIPEDLPTIEDGILTCITCHYGHGGEQPFFARLDFSKEICIRCHIMGTYGK